MSGLGVHPATTDELIELTWFAGSGRDIESAVQDAQDVLANWAILGVHPKGEQSRVYLFERSCNAVACIDGDGQHFGTVCSPSSDSEWAEFQSRHDIRV